MILHYELPNEPSKGLVRTFCGNLARQYELASSQETITCEKCKSELEKYNKSGQNI